MQLKLSMTKSTDFFKPAAQLNVDKNIKRLIKLLANIYIFIKRVIVPFFQNGLPKIL